MPKQIKKRAFRKGEKAAAVLCTVAMAVGLVFAALFILLIPDIDSSSENVQFVKAILAASAYAAFIAATLAAMVANIMSYKKANQMGDIMRAFFAGISVLAAFLSIRFMLALFFAGLDDQDMVNKIIGSGSYSDFFKNQTPSFACLIISLTLMLFVGISAIIKLAKR